MATARVEPAEGAAAESPLPVRVLVAYAAQGVGVSFLSTLFLVMYLKFATDRVGVSMFTMGAVFLVAKLWNEALKADVIDLDELRAGERKEGAYFAAWSFVNKLGNAILASSAGFALGLAGYVPNVEQTPLVRHTLIFLLGGMPLLGYAVGSLAFARFPLSEAEHARIRRELDARGAAAKA